MNAGAHWLAVSPPGTAAAANNTRQLQFRVTAPLQAFFFGATTTALAGGEAGGTSSPTTAAQQTTPATSTPPPPPPPTAAGVESAAGQRLRAALRQRNGGAPAAPDVTGSSGTGGSGGSGAAASSQQQRLSPPAPSPPSRQRRALQQQAPLSPPPFLFSALGKPLPPNVHLLTFMQALSTSIAAATLAAERNSSTSTVQPGASSSRLYIFVRLVRSRLEQSARPCCSFFWHFGSAFCSRLKTKQCAHRFQRRGRMDASCCSCRLSTSPSLSSRPARTILGRFRRAPRAVAPRRSTSSRPRAASRSTRRCPRTPRWTWAPSFL